MRIGTWRIVLVAGLAACAGGGAAGENTKGTLPGTDDSGGGGGGVVWAPAGEGKAFFLDGEADNSLFHLDLTRCLEPRDGESYYGWVSKGGTEPVAVGEIPVVAEEVHFEYEIGIDAALAGYDTFEAWANDSGVQGEGTGVWAGEVDPAVVDAMQSILIASDQTADGQGVARSLESSLQEISDFTSLVITQDGESFLDMNADAERIANSISGLNEDLDGDGTALLVDGNPGVLGTTGYLQSILDELDSVAVLFDPTDPVRDYINYAYDCLQRVEDYGDEAYQYARSGAGCAAESTCDDLLETTLLNLGYALDGQDLDGSGAIVPIDEGTVECGISYIAQMASMDVGTP